MVTNPKTSLALIQQKLDYVVEDVHEIKIKMEANYATKEWVDAEYGQTKKIVNVIVVTLGMAIVGAFATFIIRGGLK